MGRNVLIECFFVYVHFGTVSALKFFLLWNSTLEGTIMTLMIKKRVFVVQKCSLLQFQQRPTWRRSMAIPLNVKNAAKPFSPKQHWEATVTLTTITSHIFLCWLFSIIQHQTISHETSSWDPQYSHTIELHNMQHSFSKQKHF